MNFTRSGFMLRMLPGGFILILSFLISAIERESFSFLTLVLYVFLWSLTSLFILRKYRSNAESIYVNLFLFAAVSLIFLFRPYLLSDDIERYVWEGHVQNLGYSPYVTAPNDPLFDGETLNKKVNHPQMTAIYPPLMQILFRILAFIYPSLYFFKIFFSFVSIIFIFYLWKNRKYFEDAHILYALFPFLALETAWSGHLEVLPVFFLSASCLQVQKRRYFIAGLFLGFSAMLKLLPALLMIYFFKEIFVSRRNLQDSREIMKEILYFGAGFMLTLSFYIPYLWAEGYLISSLVIYSSQWVFSSFLYSILIHTGMDPFSVRIASGLILAAAGIFIFIKGRSLKTDVFYFMTALCLFSPVVHPWYLLWLVPFAGRKYFYTAVTFLSASFLMYASLEDLFLQGTWRGYPVLTVSAYSFAVCVFILEHFYGSLLHKHPEKI